MLSQILIIFLFLRAITKTAVSSQLRTEVEENQKVLVIGWKCSILCCIFKNNKETWIKLVAFNSITFSNLLINTVISIYIYLFIYLF